MVSVGIVIGSAVAMEELSIQYFRDLLEKHREELKNYCQKWEENSSDKSIPDEVADEIRTTIGLTNLLLRQKLKQFGELIDDSEFKRGEKEITCIDLQGFWDMVFHEVEKIQKNFKKLEKCQSNNWVFIEEPVPKIEAKKKPTIAATAKVTVQSKAHVTAARQRLAEAKQRMMDAKKKMKEAKNDANKDFVVIESKPRENGVEEKTVDTKEQLRPALVTVEDKESLNKVSKKSTSKSSKKTAQQDMTGQQKRQKSERISKGKENLIESGKKPELLTVTAPKAPRAKRAKSPKEADVPLQCVTRSARRAMLANQGD
ncbi:hypothetical protein JTE90_004293 [Oedothorax gibbosus]|uniref:Disks large-associated protein 5 n=1 Tax=Oedothorax gibbosus TaxID=931172 RepID=A0AAV6VN83_9ARAC|nr:hypothetical protein JTE90_004293 [Oedothorax gibbosus]